MRSLRTWPTPVLVAASTVVLLSSCGGDDDSSTSKAAATTGPAHTAFVSRPDLTAPEITVTRTGAQSTADDGALIAVGPKGDDVPMNGAMLVDDSGEPVWIKPTTGETFDVRVQQYQGQPVLTYWQGTMGAGFGFGKLIVLNSSYQQIATVDTGGDLGTGQVDIHEGRLTSQGTALVTAYVKTKTDLSSIGGPKNGYVWDGVVQEIDVATGTVLLTWHSLDHVPVSETESKYDGKSGTAKTPFDYFHINSISEDTDGNLLVSARNTWTVYKVDRTTGDVLWRMGGKENDFQFGTGVRYAWQHDAERQADGTITLYDNESEPDEAAHSRGLRLAVDETARTVGVVTEYDPPDAKRLSGSQGSIEVLPDGNVLVGWGSRHYYSEFTADGQLIWDADLGSGDNYRAFKDVWTGTPTTDPDAAVQGSNAYASWNGATEVASWRVVSGDDEASATAGDPVTRTGFETTLPLDGSPAYVRVEALDATGQVLGSTVADT